MYLAGRTESLCLHERAPVDAGQGHSRAAAGTPGTGCLWGAVLFAAVQGDHLADQQLFLCAFLSKFFGAFDIGSVPPDLHLLLFRAERIAAWRTAPRRNAKPTVTPIAATTAIHTAFSNEKRQKHRLFRLLSPAAILHSVQGLLRPKKLEASNF